MKNARNPIRSEKKVLMKNNKDWTQWLVLKTSINKEDKSKIDISFQNKETNEIFNTQMSK